MIGATATASATAPLQPRGATAVRGQVLAAARALVERGLVVGTAGNVSGRLDGAFVITPTRRPYHELVSGDLVLVGEDGTIQGSRAPSREWPLHLAAYRARPDAGAVVHTHSPHAVAWSFLEAALEPEVEETSYYRIGRVRTVPRLPAGTPELAAAVAEALRHARAALLAGHGVVAIGDDVQEALTIAHAVEHHAQIAWLVRSAAGG